MAIDKSKMSQEVLSEKDLSWEDPSLDSVKGTETPKDPSKGYIALLGWSINAIKAAQKFDRRYVVVAPEWIFVLLITSRIFHGTLSV